MRRLLYLAAFALVGTAAIHGTCRAQTVRGRLIDQSTGAAVSGGFVRLVDSTGRRISETLSNASGNYQLRAPAPGAYMLRVERLGYANYQTGRIVLDTTVTVRDVILPQNAIELPAITASADSRCNARNANAAAAAAVWEEVRKALAITSWTSQHASVYYSIESARRTLDPASRRVLQAEIDTTAGSMGGNPFKSAEGDSLLKRGFIQADEAGKMAYYGPDADLFMSDGFQQTHCFHAVIDRKQPGLVGVAFQSNGSIRPYDIRGTLWIDKRSYELRRLEFTYDNVPVPAARGIAGGTVNFARLDTGMWIISEWALTAPITGETQRNPGGVMSRPLLGYLRVSQRVIEAFVEKKRVYGKGQ